MPEQDFDNGLLAERLSELHREETELRSRALWLESELAAKNVRVAGLETQLTMNHQRLADLQAASDRAIHDLRALEATRTVKVTRMIGALGSRLRRKELRSPIEQMPNKPMIDPEDAPVDSLGADERRLRQLETLAQGQARDLAQIATQVEELASQARLANEVHGAQHAQLIEILRFIHTQPNRQRERLRALRAELTYEQPYTEPNPLVSVVIPTYDNWRLLQERAIPSVLAQTYLNFEIVVVGDAAPAEARIAVESFNDPRIRFFNLPYRGPYPQDPANRWLVAGVPPYNEAVRRARGLWIAPLDDDDSFRPQHIQRLLEYARQERVELAYSRICQRAPDGSTTPLGCFPPAHGQFGLQSVLYHRGLARIFELELADAALGLPYDWGLCQRLLEGGARFGMLDEETVDYYPSRLWTPRWDDGRDATNGSDEHGTDQLPIDPPVDGRAPAPEWEFVAEGWNRARNNSELSSVGWSRDDVARAYADKWPLFLEAIQGPGPLGVYHEVPEGIPIDREDPIAQNTVLAYAYALGRASNGAARVSVLDWGGALGHYYVLAQALFPELELDYHCRELPSVCAEGRRLLPSVAFHDSDDCLKRSYDLVVASASLMYEEDWMRRLASFAGAAHRWVFITRVLFVRQQPSFVVLQRAQSYGYGTEYLGWVLNYDALLNAALDCGLRLVREFTLLRPFRIDGAPEEISFGGFLFQRGEE